MTYATLMVHLELGRSNAGLLRIAGELTKRFHAGVIGIAGCQAVMMSDNSDYAPGDFIMQVRDETKQEITEAEAEFRKALGTSAAALEWRSTVMCMSLSGYIANEARSADLVITSANSGELLNASRQIDTGELLMQAGRPVLVTPGNAEKLDLERMVVGWKDTSEARRAALDALPLLKKAAHVSVVELGADDELTAARTHVKDVVGWLKGHGVAAKAIAVRSNGDDGAHLNAIAGEQHAGIVVAGAYGHSRLREYVLGGVTRELLRCAERCSFMSH